MQIVSQNLSVARFSPADAVQGARSRKEQSETAASAVVVASSNSTTADTLEISPAAEAELAAADEHSIQPEDEHDHDQYSLAAKVASEESPSESDSTEGTDPSKSAETEAEQTGELSEEQQVVVEELESTDREVRTHEQAHLAAAGGFATGGPTFEYQRGPDGQQYAVGGEVGIDTSAVPGDPEATIAKARVVRAAANAPSEPSSQDRAVAAAAAKLEIQARQELRQQEVEATEDDPFKPTAGFGEFLTSEDEPSESNEAISAGLFLDLIG